MYEDPFVASLLSLGVWLSRVGSRLMAPFGLSQQESVILLFVAQHGPLSQTGIRSDLLLERSNVSKAVSRLQSQGLLHAEPSPRDARVALVGVTSQGARVAERCRRAYQEWNRQWLDGMDEQHLAEALAVLREVRERSHGYGAPGADPGR